MFYTPSLSVLLVFAIVYLGLLFSIAYFIGAPVALTFAIAFALGQLFQHRLG